MMKLYSMALSAKRRLQDKIEIQIISTIGVSESDHQALVEGVALARQLFTDADGWFEHKAVGMEVPRTVELDGYRLTWQVEQIISSSPTENE